MHQLHALRQQHVTTKCLRRQLVTQALYYIQDNRYGLVALVVEVRTYPNAQ